MTSRRNLGPVFAIAGAAAIGAAVVAGFLVVGGPGDARNQRLDEQAMDRLYEVALAAQCVFATQGNAPANMDELRSAIADIIKRDPDNPACRPYSSDSRFPESDYSRIGPDRIRLCGQFRSPYEPENERQTFPRYRNYERVPELRTARPAGRHCYEIQLVN